MKASGHSAVMSQRATALDALDDFPTPPWATRALTRVVLPMLGLSLEGTRVWEPAAGRGIMASVLAEQELASLFTSDVHRYADGIPDVLNAVASFVGEGGDVLPARRYVDWVVTNPPFKLALDFALRGLSEARQGVALLVRSNWAEGGERYERLFKPHPPLAVAQFVERVPMVRGRFDPEASTATAYAWFIWLASATHDRFGQTRFLWIPPGQRAALSRPSDVRFARLADGAPDR